MEQARGRDSLTLLRLFGIPVTAADARHLTATLIADGEPHALSAAHVIEKGLERDLYTVVLERDQRDAILRVLDDAPAGLTALRAVLARDNADRNYWN